MPRRSLFLPLFAVIVLALMAGMGVSHAMTGTPTHDRDPRLLGDPAALIPYWHDQRWQDGDFYACALYAQVSILEAMGYDFAAELAAARALGQRDGWYVPDQGALGLGQPLRAKGMTFDVFGTSLGGEIAPKDALYRLRRGIAAGEYAVVNLDATQLSYYRGSKIVWHTIWVTGLRLDRQGRVTAVIANDSYHGAAVEYAAGEFLAAWGHERLNYYAIFVHRPEGEKVN